MNASMERRRMSAIESGAFVDRVLMLTVATLLGIGLVMVASASISLAERDYGGPLYFFWRQLGAIAVGCLLGVLAFRMPLDFWRQHSQWLVIGAFALMLSVLVPGLGRTVNGSTRWLNVAGMNIVQVSEPARLLILLYMAGYAVRHNQALRTTTQGFLRPLAVSGAGCLMLLAQPDFGAALMLMVVTLSVLFVAGARLRDFFACGAVVVCLGAIVALAAPYRVVRLTSFLNPWGDPYNTGFQLTQSLIAIGTGEWTGLGLGGSVQKLFYLPEAHTDFVFAVIAEEFGLVGAVLLVALFGVLAWRAFMIAREAAVQERWFAAAFAFGFASWQAAQVFVNLGVNMGILPTKGLTLPLVSYGRSSIVVTLVGIALLLRVDFENRFGEGATRRRPLAQWRGA
ncbi:MAG: putative lipid II flippase FtsW [Gammaproteobacteria bacterium]|nr:putative lipid II flippase FtsW [Gammaproteobacteria bacterium]